jgi:hypothetical protein
MRKAFVLTLVAAAVACSDRTAEQTGPSTISPSSVVLSGTVYAAENGLPIPRVLVEVVQGVNTGRSTFSNDGNYQLADLAPGTLTLQFTTSEYRDLQRTEAVRANTTLNVQLERKGLTLSGRISTEWGESIGDVGVEALHDGRVAGGGTSDRSTQTTGLYRIPTLPPADYVVRAIKWGYVTLQRPVTMTGDTTLDFVLDRVRVSIFGVVMEAPPCGGVIQDARVEIVTGPDVGSGVSSTATGYRLTNINWGKFRLRAAKTGYMPVEMSMDMSSPGSKEGREEQPAPSNVQQDFVLHRIISC